MPNRVAITAKALTRWPPPSASMHQSSPLVEVPRPVLRVVSMTTDFTVPAGHTTGDASLNSGYLLRSWLTVQKLKQVKSYIVDGVNPSLDGDSNSTGSVWCGLFW